MRVMTLMEIKELKEAVLNNSFPVKKQDYHLMLTNAPYQKYVDRPRYMREFTREEVRWFFLLVAEAEFTDNTNDY